MQSAAQVGASAVAYHGRRTWCLQCLMCRSVVRVCLQTLRELGDFMLEVPKHRRGVAMLRAHAHLFPTTIHEGREMCMSPHRPTGTRVPPGTPGGNAARNRHRKKRQYYHSAAFLPIEASVDEGLSAVHEPLHAEKRPMWTRSKVACRIFPGQTEATYVHGV